MNKKIFARFSVEDVLAPLEKINEIPKYVVISGNTLRLELIEYEDVDSEMIEEDKIKTNKDA